MGILNNFKRKNAERAPVVIPESMKAQDPVNYNSVLDYLVGLSQDDFKKMTKSAEIYRKANRDVAGLIGVEDEPTTSIQTAKPEVSDDELDAMLNTPADELATAFIEDEIPSEPVRKAHAPDHKVEVKE